MQKVIEPYYRPMGWDRPTMRMLVCDGSRLLAYVGICTETTFSRRQMALFRAVMPALRRRLIDERRFDEAQLCNLALEAALELIPAPAFVTSSLGAIRYANAAGVRLLETDRRETVGSLHTKNGPRPELYDVTRLTIGNDTSYLAVRRINDREPALRCAIAARRWGLTRREADVLGWLVRGATNYRIAAELGCAEATIEIHVSRILAKFDCANRSQAVGKVLGLCD